jgi:hypothetical protein
MIVAAIRAALLADAAVAALCDERIYPARLPQAGLLPAVVLHLISGVSDQATGGPTGPVERRVQVDCWGERYGDAAGLATAARRRLDGLRGTFAGETFGRCRCVHEGDLGAGRRLDFMLWHLE